MTAPNPTATATPRPRRLRRVIATLGCSLAVAATAIAVTYPGVGALTYRLTVGVETRLDGLHTEHAEVDGLEMAYYEGGPVAAPTIVMLHGYSADRDVWARFAAELVDDYHVVIPDLAGHGDTPFVEGADYSAPAQADRVAGLLDVLDIDRTHIIGNSMGGFVAASFARAYPTRMLSLGLSDAAGVIAPEPSAMDILMERDGQNPFLLEDPDQFDDFYAMTMAKPPWVPGFVKDAMAQDYVDREPELAEIFEGFHHRDLLDEHLDEITAPAYVMWGEEDQLVDPSAADVWVDGLPDATLVTYPGIGHMPMLEIPEESAADYAAFLEDLS
ncbi:alpha/beta hydrolase [Nocardioides humilatus]|uniref:Alpha/beta hydrolase n=1 Tax=Nocardioides humilatus TaxID=2607660 RepID=A0A5B1LMB2_9ACTN|nr:alpha/beta hydrolase [Nocardioides humilatus]KAA1421654.1 alpha/beta hydrolase [Nocardioides humilatus]